MKGSRVLRWRPIGYVVAAAAGLLAAPVSAQELTQTFTNPSFGGNPFNSAHLLGIATAQRPDRPTSASTALTQTQLFAQQLQSRLLSALSAGITTAITGSQPGDTGEFVIGDQRVTFENTGTVLKVTIFNTTTGETTEITVPVFNFTSGSGSGGTGGGGTRAATSPEAVLSGVLAASTNSGSSNGSSGTVEIPSGTPPL